MGEGIEEAMEVAQSASEYGLVSAENETTKAQDDLAIMIDDAVAALGFNNSEFLKKVEQLRKHIKSQSSFDDKTIDEFLKFVLPHVGTNSILDTIAKFEGYRANIVYSSFANLFKNIKYTISGEEYSLFDLLETESKNLANASKLSEYVINNESVKQLLSEERYLPLYKAIVGIITGA